MQVQVLGAIVLAPKKNKFDPSRFTSSFIILFREQAPSSEKFTSVHATVLFYSVQL